MSYTEIYKKGLQHTYEVVIKHEDIQQNVNEEVLKLAPKVNMKGFRPGKVPTDYLEKLYGDSIATDFVQATQQKHIDDIITTKGLVVCNEEIIKSDYKPSSKEDFKFQVKFELYPEIRNLEDMELDFTRKTVIVDEKTRQDFYLSALEKFLEKEEVEDSEYKTKADDYVEIDFLGSIDGVEFEGGKADDYLLRLGSKSFIDGFEDQLLEKKLGEKVVVSVTFPEVYQDPNLQGKDAKFDVTIKKISHIKPPELTEELAQKLNMPNKDQLEKTLEDALQKDLTFLSNLQFKKDLFDFIERSDCIIDDLLPESIQEATRNQVVLDLHRYNKLESIKGVQLSEQTPYETVKDKLSAEDQEEIQKQTYRRVKSSAYILGYAQKNKITVSESETLYSLYQQTQGLPEEQRASIIENVKNNPALLKQLKNPAIEEKTIDFIKKKVILKDEEVSRASIEESNLI